MTDAEAYRRIYEALANHGQQLAALPCRPNAWVIDGAGSPQDCVINLAASAPKICGLEAACSFGRGWRQYRPGHKKHRVTVGDNWHKVTERNNRQWFIWNSDYWKEIAQKAWTGHPGSPGSCSLPGGHHQEFARQICNEPLLAKTEAGGKTIWIFKDNGEHDYGDTMSMAYMAAAALGITQAGTPAGPTRKTYRQEDFQRR